MGRKQTEPVSSELAVSLGPAPGRRMVETLLLLGSPDVPTLFLADLFSLSRRNAACCSTLTTRELPSLCINICKLLTSIKTWADPKSSCSWLGWNAPPESLTAAEAP